MLTPLQQALLDAALAEFADIPEHPEGLPEAPITDWSVWEDSENKILYPAMQPNCRMYFFASRDIRAIFIRNRLSQGYCLRRGPKNQAERI